MATTLLLLRVSLILSVLCISPFTSTSTSRLKNHHHHHHEEESSFIRVTLHHIDSGKNLTKLQLLHHGINRSTHRLQTLKSILLSSSSSSSSSSELEAPVRAGNGEYLMKLSIGTPPETFPAVLDTGSDLIWTQCNNPCKNCYNQPTPIFDPRNSSSFSELPCDSKFCDSLPSSTCSHGCRYVYTYGDYSVTQGVMATETFTFGGDEEQKPSSVHNIAFGCGEDNEGEGFEQASGLVGLGRGPLSLVSQLSQPRFSYCLTSIDGGDNAAKTSTLFLGGAPARRRVNGTGGAEAVTVALLTNPMKPSFYYVPLEGITVGDTRLSIEKSTFEVSDDGSGGVIIDSGTTITYLEESAFEELKKEFVSQTSMAVDKSGSDATGLEVCFTLPRGTNQVEIPRLVLHFKGGDLELPAENYMIADTSVGVGCLAMGASNGMSIFGNVQQQNILVSHDLQKRTVSFLPTNCDHL